MRWTLSSGTVSGYKVYRKRTAPTTDPSYTMLTQLGATPALPFRDTTASGSSTYSYGVAAFNQGGSSPMATAQANTPGCPIASGQVQWAGRLGGTGPDQGRAIAAAGPNGDLIVAGYFTNTANFGGVSLTSAGNADMFIARYTAAGALVWAKRYGGDGDDLVSSLAVDGSGNIVVTGYFWGTADFGGGPLTSVTNTFDIFIAKFSPTGTYIWARSFGGPYGDLGNGVAADSNGDVIMTGAFRGTVDFGAGALTSSGLGGSDTILAKYSGATGACLWAHNFPSESDDQGVSVGIDANNNILMVGSYEGGINYTGGSLFGPGFLLSAGLYDIAVAKFSPAGAHIWSRSFGGGANDWGTGLAVDRNGDVLVSCNFVSPTMTIGTTTLSSQLQDICLFKLSGTDGTPRWARRAGGPNNDYSTSIAVDGNNDVVMTGSFNTTADFGGGVMTGAGSTDIFVAKYTAAGAYLWSQAFGGLTDDEGFGVTVDASGNVAASGYFRDPAHFGSSVLTSAGTTDGFLVKLAP